MSAARKNSSERRVNTMSIEKKSLISTLKTTKKANVAKEQFSGASLGTVPKSPSLKVTSGKMLSKKVTSAKMLSSKLKSAKMHSAKMQSAKIR
jgi:hypothetical protein